MGSAKNSSRKTNSRVRTPATKFSQLKKRLDKNRNRATTPTKTK